eukprot:795366-Rhodomonas_salina.1
MRQPLALPQQHRQPPAWPQHPCNTCGWICTQHGASQVQTRNHLALPPHHRHPPRSLPANRNFSQKLTSQPVFPSQWHHGLLPGTSVASPPQHTIHSAICVAVEQEECCRRGPSDAVQVVCKLADATTRSAGHSCPNEAGVSGSSSQAAAI